MIRKKSWEIWVRSKCQTRLLSLTVNGLTQTNLPLLSAFSISANIFNMTYKGASEGQNLNISRHSDYRLDTSNLYVGLNPPERFK